jgi:hypothetical protein
MKYPGQDTSGACTQRAEVINTTMARFRWPMGKMNDSGRAMVWSMRAV